MKERIWLISVFIFVSLLWLSGFLTGRVIVYPTDPFCIVQNQTGYIYTDDTEIHYKKGQSICTVFTSKTQSKVFVK